MVSCMYAARRFNGGTESQRTQLDSKAGWDTAKCYSPTEVTSYTDVVTPTLFVHVSELNQQEWAKILSTRWLFTCFPMGSRSAPVRGLILKRSRDWTKETSLMLGHGASISVKRVRYQIQEVRMPLIKQLNKTNNQAKNPAVQLWSLSASSDRRTCAC